MPIAIGIGVSFGQELSTGNAVTYPDPPPVVVAPYNAYLLLLLEDI